MITQELVPESDLLMNKKVISSDSREIGNIVSVDKKSLTILRGGDNHYIIPKSRAEALIGENIVVDFRLNDLLLVELASLSYLD
ncbi:MAG TPA: hypothetical protein VFI73_13520 [Candidatus Nitrosopolaris sp.]|nr:hypothetical protein [Candidatus Nitrosopolaris sp.]